MLKKIAILFLSALLVNAIVVFFNWVNHIFVIGLNPFVGVLALFFFFLIVLFMGIVAVRRMHKYLKKNAWLNTAALFLMGFFVFLIGDFVYSKLYGYQSIDFQLRDTYFVIATAHLFLVAACICLAFSAIYYLFAIIAGREMNASMGKIHFIITLVVFLLICCQPSYNSLVGMPRRYIDYSEWAAGSRFVELNLFYMAGILLLICGQVLFVFNLIYSAVKGKNALNSKA